MKMMVLYPDEHYELSEEESDDNLSLLKKLVGGWIEYAYPHDPVAGSHHVCLNEEGALIPLQQNRFARLILQELGYSFPLYGPFGVVVLMGSDLIDGDDESLSQITIDHVIDIIIPRLAAAGLIKNRVEK